MEDYTQAWNKEAEIIGSHLRNQAPQPENIFLCNVYNLTFKPTKPTNKNKAPRLKIIICDVRQ